MSAILNVKIPTCFDLPYDIDYYYYGNYLVSSDPIPQIEMKDVQQCGHNIFTYFSVLKRNYFSGRSTQGWSCQGQRRKNTAAQKNKPRLNAAMWRTWQTKSATVQHVSLCRYCCWLFFFFSFQCRHIGQGRACPASRFTPFHLLLARAVV